MITARFFIAVLVVGCALATALHYGAREGRPFLYVGATAAVILLVLAVVVGLSFLAVWWRPSFPRCKTGKCKDALDYERLGTEGDVTRYRCRCGIEYLLSPDGTLKVVESGETIPFMRHTRFGRWKPSPAK